MKNVFTQTITFRTDQPEALVAIVREWDALQASQEVMGFMEVRILADRDDPGRYVLVNDFGVVDPNVSAAQEAYINNERFETQAFAKRIGALVKGDAEWHHYDELYRTTFGQKRPLNEMVQCMAMCASLLAGSSGARHSAAPGPAGRVATSD